MPVSQDRIAQLSGVISKPTLQVVFASNLIWFRVYHITLGDNRSSLGSVNSIGYCTGGTSSLFSSQSFSGWLHRAGRSDLSLRSEWASLWILRLLLPEWSSSKRPISFFTAGARSNQKNVPSYDHLCSCLSRLHMDNNLRRQIFFFSLFFQAHRACNQDSHILLDCGSHHRDFMAISDSGAVHFMPLHWSWRS